MEGNILRKRHRPRSYGCEWHPNHVVVSGRKKNCVHDSGRFTREGLYISMSPWTRFSSHLLTFPPSPSSPPSLPQASTTEAAENLIAEGIPARILELHALHQVRGKGEEVRRHSFALYICEAILTLLLLCTCFPFAVPRPFPPFQHSSLSPLFFPFLSPPSPHLALLFPPSPLQSLRTAGNASEATAARINTEGSSPPSLPSPGNPPSPPARTGVGPGGGEEKEAVEKAEGVGKEGGEGEEAGKIDHVNAEVFALFRRVKALVLRLVEDLGVLR